MIGQVQSKLHTPFLKYLSCVLIVSLIYIICINICFTFPSSNYHTLTFEKYDTKYSQSNEFPREVHETLLTLARERAVDNMITLSVEFPMAKVNWVNMHERNPSCLSLCLFVSVYESLSLSLSLVT